MFYQGEKCKIGALANSRNDLDPSIMNFNPSKSTKTIKRPRRGRANNEAQISTLSIAEKLDTGAYSTLSELESDLEKQVAAVKSEIFDPFPYDTFLQSAKSLIRLELGRLSADVQADSVEEVKNTPDPLDATSNRQALYTIGPHGPLFTSLSFLPLPVPDEANTYTFQNEKGQSLYAGKLDIMPLSGSLTQPVPPIGTSAGQPSKVAVGRRMPFRPLEDAARDYIQQKLRPKTTPVHHAEYLDYGSFASFAPEYDEGEALIDRATYVKLEESAYEQYAAQKDDELVNGEEKEEIKEEVVIKEPEIDVSLLETWEPEDDAEARFKAEENMVNGESKEPEKSLEERVDELSLKIQTLEGLQFFRLSFDTQAATTSYELKLGL